MTYERVYSYDPAIIIAEDDRDGYFHVYVEGDLVGIGHSMDAAEEIAEEVFDSLVGDPLDEGAEE